jgi:hypothetical protein
MHVRWPLKRGINIQELLQEETMGGIFPRAAREHYRPFWADVKSERLRSSGT